MALISDYQHRFNKALGLLGDVKATDRTFLRDNAVLRKLATAEKEQSLSYDALQKNSAYAPVLHNVHPDEVHPSASDVDAKGRPARYNTNQFRKLSSGIVINATAAVMLAGTRVDEAGRAKEGLDKDLEIAALIYDLPGRKTRGGDTSNPPALLDKDKITIDDKYISAEFGDKVLGHVKGIHAALAQLEKGDGDAIPSDYAAVALAISAARVREAAKIVSAKLIDRLIPEAREQFLIENGLKDAADPAKTLLEKEFSKLQQLMRRKDIAQAVREPIEKVLVPAIEDYYRDGNAAVLYSYPKSSDDKNSKANDAYDDFTSALPVLNYHTDASQKDYADLDVHKMLLLQTRYHQDTTRKDGSSIFSHVLDTIGHGSRTMGDSLRNTVVMVLGLHDWREDGGVEVAGFNADMPALEKEFGRKMTLLISEMTDDYSKNAYVLRSIKALQDSPGHHTFIEDAKKNQKTMMSHIVDRVRQQELASPDDSNEEIEAQIRKHLETSPFSLTTSGPKLADVVSTARMILQEPQTNDGQWKYSGARVGWLEGSKGYAKELYLSIAGDVQSFFSNPDYAAAPLSSGHIPAELNLKLLNFLSVVKKTLDAYTLQNLTVLADEFGLDAKGREELRDTFINTSGVKQEAFKAFLDRKLVKLEEGVPADLTTVNARESTPEHQVRRYDNLLRLRESFSAREMFRKSLLACADDLRNENVAPIIQRAMAEPNWKKMDREVVEQYDSKMGIDKERFTQKRMEDLGPYTKALYDSATRATGGRVTVSKT